MTKEYKVAVLGYGTRGRIHADAYKAVMRYFPSCPVKPVLNEVYCASDGEAEAAAASGLKVNRDLDKTIENRETFLVDICLPPQKRYAAAKTAFESGQHVFSENPFTGTLLDAYKMAELAAQYPIQIASFNYICRRTPAAIYARNLLQEGRLGKVMEVVCSYYLSWHGIDPPLLPRFEEEGGTLDDLECFALWRLEEMMGNSGPEIEQALDMLYFQTGMRPIEVRKTTHVPERIILSEEAALCIKKTRPERVVEHDGHYWFIVKTGGAIGPIHHTRNRWGNENSHNFVIYCEHGALRWSYDDLTHLEIYDARTPERGWVRMLCDRKACAYFNFADGHMIGYRDLIVFACYDNLRKINGLSEIAPTATFADALEVERAKAALRRSSEKRRWVKLSEITRPEE